MRRHRKLIIVLSAVLGLVSAVLWWAKRSPWLSERLRAPIEQALARASGRPVVLGGVGGGLSGWIWLQDVGLGPDPLGRGLDLSVTARAVGLQFGLLNLLQGRTELGDLKALRVEDPSLFLLRRGTGRVASSTARALPDSDWRQALQGFPLPALQMELRNGEAFEHSEGQPLRRLATDLRLGLEPDAQGWRLRGQAGLESGGRVALWGRSRADLTGAELKARISGVQVAPWAALAGLPAGLSVSAGSLAGDLDLVQSENLTWSLRGQGDLAALALRYRDHETLADGSARWIWDGRTLQLNRITGRAAGGRLDGRLRLPGGAAVVGQLNLRRAELAALLALAGAPQALSLGGRAELELNARAVPGATAWTLNLESEQASWQGRPLRTLGLRAQAQGVSAEAAVDLGWEGGQGRIQLDFDGQGLRQARLDAQALPADWAAAWAGAELAGLADLKGSYRRLDGQTPWELSVKSARLQVGALPLVGLTLSGGGTAQQARLRLEADLESWKGLNASVEAVGVAGRWELRRLRIFEGSQLRVDAGGRWRAPNLDLNLRSATLPLKALRPWLPVALHSLSGTVQAQGALHWRSAGAGGELNLRAPDLDVEGHALPWVGRLEFSPRGVSLSAVEFRHGEIRGSAQAPAWKGPWTSALTLHSAQLAPWMALAAAPGSISGTASGSLSLDSAGGLKASLRLEEPWPQALPRADLNLELQSAGGHWRLERAELRQGTGRLSAHGQVDLKGGQAWQGQAQWQGLRLRGAEFSGQAVLAPAPDVDGLLKVGPWSLSKTAMPDLHADLRLKDGRLDSVQARLGQGTRLHLERQPSQWWARAQLAGQDPAAVLGPWLGTAQPSGLALNGWVELSRPRQGGAVRWQLDLSDAAAPNSRLTAEGPGPGSGLAQVQWSGLDLERLGTALRRLDLAPSLPDLGGLTDGQVRTQAGGLSFSAQVQNLRLAGVGLGPAELRGWWGSQRWTLTAFNSGGSGPQLRLRQWQGRSGPAGWSAQGDMEMEQWPAAIFIISGEGHLKLQGKDGKGMAEAEWARFAVGERSYRDLDLKASWDSGRLSLAESGRVPGLRATARWKDGDFELVDLQAQSGRGRAWLKGAVLAGGGMSFEGSSQGLPAAELTGWLGWEQVWTGAAYGSLNLGGTVKEPRGAISVKIEDGSVSGLPFDLATGVVHLEPGWVQLSPLGPIRLSRSNGVALEVGGRVPFGGPDGEPLNGLDVTAELKGGGLGLLAGLPAIEAASGPLELSLSFKGRRDDPQISGRFQVSQGRLTPAWLLPPLEGLEVFAQIEDGQFFLQKAEAQVTGDGPLLKLEPAVEGSPAFMFERWLPAAFNLRLRASRSGLPLRSTGALKFIDGQAHPNLRLAGSWRSPSLEGELRLDKGSQDKALVHWPAEFAKGAAEGDGFFSQMRYELKLTARQDVMVRTDAAQVFVDTGEEGLLLSGGGGGERELEGRLRLTRGDIDYLLASFELAQDRENYIDFRRGTVPELELWGLKHVEDVLITNESVRRDVDVRLHAFGPLGSVQMRLEADDTRLTQQQLASLAGLGVDASDPRSQGGFVRLLGKVPARFLTNLVRGTGIVDVVDVRLPAVEEAFAGPGGTQGPGSLAGQPGSLTRTGRTLVEIKAGKYYNENLYLGVTGQINEGVPGVDGASTGVGPAVGGKVQYEFKDKTRLSAEHSVDTSGQSEQRVMFERSSGFPGYDPRRRRQELTPGAIRARQTPQPIPTPTLTPAPRWP